MSVQLLNDAAADSVASGYRFGLNKDAVVSELRQLADQIEAGSVLPQRFAHGVENSAADFVIDTYTVAVAFKREGR